MEFYIDKSKEVYIKLVEEYDHVILLPVCSNTYTKPQKVHLYHYWDNYEKCQISHILKLMEEKK